MLFAAWFDGERLADKLIEMIEAEVSKVCAPSLRADEISKLECEIAQLTRLDVLLAEQGDAVHDPDTPPMALLGVVVQLSSAAA